MHATNTKLKRKVGIFLTFLLAFLIAFTGSVPDAKALTASNDPVTYYNTHGTTPKYFEDGYIYWGDRFKAGTSNGIFWHVMGYRFKVTSNGRTNYVDYNLGTGVKPGYTTKSPAIKTISKASGGYTYARDGVNYESLISDIMKKDRTLGGYISSGEHDVNITIDSITEVYNRGTGTSLSGPHFTASATKSALQKYGLSTSIVDNYYGLRITIPKAKLPIIKYVRKAVSFPEGGSYQSSPTTHYVKPGKPIYLNTIYMSQEVELTQQYLNIGDKDGSGENYVDDLNLAYNHASDSFSELSGSTEANFLSTRSVGFPWRNANKDTNVRFAFSFDKSGQTWYTYGAAKNINGIYEGGSERNNKYLYTFNTDGDAPTFAYPSQTGWKNSPFSFNIVTMDEGAGIKTATLKRNGTIVRTFTATPDTRETTVYMERYRQYDEANRFEIETEDNVGNKSSTTFEVNVDVDAPNLSITQNPTAWTNKDVTLTAKASDALSGVDYISSSNGVVTSGDTATRVVSSNGVYSFKVRDNAGNETEESITVTNIDKVAPIGNVSQTPTAWTNGDVTLNLTNVADTGGSGLKNIKLPNGTVVTGTSATQVVKSNGTYVFEITDNAGNVTSRSITVTNIDKVAPTGTVSQTPTGWTKESVTLNLTNVKDTGGSGLQEIELPSGGRVTGTSASEVVTKNGDYSFIIYDKAGNKKVVTHHVGNIDEEAPTATLTQTPTAWTKGNVTLNLTNIKDTGGSGVKNIKLPNGSFVTTSTASQLVTENGSYTFYIYDNAGNATSRTIEVTNIDRDAPTGLLTRNPSTWTNGDVTLTLSGVTDGKGSGIKHIVRPNKSLATGVSTATQDVSVNGDYVFQMEDIAGNISTRTITVDNIDKVTPSATFNPSSVSWTKNNQNIGVTATDSGGSGLKQWRYRTSSNNGSTYGAWGAYITTASASIPLDTHGIHRIQVQVYDNAGNVKTVTSGSYYLDKVLPNGTITANTTAPTANAVTLTATGSDADSGMHTIRKPDGTTVTASSTTFDVTENGTYAFTFTDKAGNAKTTSIVVSNIYKGAPTATLTQTPTEWTRGNVTLNLTAKAEGAPIKSIRKPDGTTVTGTTASHIVSANNTYSFVVTDEANNSITKTINVTNIDRVAPTGSLSQTPTAWTNGNVTLNLTGIADVGSGVKSVTLPNGTVTTGSAVSYTVTANGTYQMVIEDNVGNQTTRSITVTNIDKVAPTLSLNYDSGANVIRATAKDLLSGVQSITLPNGTVVNGASATYTPPAIGKYTFKATDKAGNVTTRSVSLDSPEIGLSVDTTEWTNQNVTITAEGYRAMNPIDYIELPNGQKVSGDTATYEATANGTYTFTVYDTAGFRSTDSIQVTNIDKVKPAGAFTFLPGDTALTVRYTGSDALSGVKQIILPNLSAVSSTTASYGVTKPGTYTAIVEDHAGNRTNVTATVVAPTVNISKEVTSWTNRESYKLTASTTPRYASTAKIQAPFDSATWVTGNALAKSITKNGTYEFKVNDGGIVATGSISITNFDREESIITIQEKAKSDTSATYNVRITEIGDAK